MLIGYNVILLFCFGTSSGKGKMAPTFREPPRRKTHQAKHAANSDVLFFFINTEIPASARAKVPGTSPLTLSYCTRYTRGTTTLVA
jgi:hypothetical protein